MARKGSARGFRKRKREQGDVGVACEKKDLTIMHLNANGLSEETVYDVASAAAVKDVGIIAISETHFRREQNIIHHNIEGYNLFEPRRSDASEDKGGGGIAIYCQSNGPLFKVHSPAIKNPVCAFVNNERIWVLSETKAFKTAICCVYMGCNYNDDRNDEWNNLIYTTIGEEQNDLRRQGFRVCIVGDMNGHIGCQPGIGIIRNKPHINQNGQMLLNFESNNDLCIMKKEASGLWT